MINMPKGLKAGWDAPQVSIVGLFERDDTRNGKHSGCWKMGGPGLSRCISMYFLLKMGDIPASYVSLPDGILYEFLPRPM